MTGLTPVSSFALLDTLLENSVCKVEMDQRGGRFIFVESISAPEMRSRILAVPKTLQIYFHGLGWRDSSRQTPAMSIGKSIFLAALALLLVAVGFITQAK